MKSSNIKVNINNMYNKKSKNVKSNNTIITVVLIVLLFTSFFSFLYLKDIERNYIVKQNKEKDSFHNSYMLGFSDNTFRPNENITRGEMSIILTRLDNNYNSSIKYYNSYLDVDKEYGNEIAYLLECGIFDNKNEKFYPNEKVTRKEFLIILAKFKKHLEVSNNFDYTNGRDGWYEEYIDIIENTMPDLDTYNVMETINSFVTRAEACSIINRSFNRVLQLDRETLSNIKKLNKFIDINEKDWYFEDIMEATISHKEEYFHLKEMKDANEGSLNIDYPDKAYIDVKVILQNPELPTGCEITALAQILNYYGYNVDKVHLSDKYLTKVNIGKSDFKSEFVGNPKTKNGFGCYVDAIYDAATRYFNDYPNNHKPIDLTGYSIEEIYEIVSKGYPVNIWTTVNMINSNKVLLWTYNDRHIYWTLNEHCVTLIGYDKEKSLVYTADPLKGITTYDMTLFEHRYNELGKQAFALIDNNISLNEKDKNVTSITFANGINTLNLTDIYNLNVIVEPPYAQNTSLIWQSGNKDIISVSNGVLSANGIGKTKIRVSANNEVYNEIEIEVR